MRALGGALWMLAASSCLMPDVKVRPPDAGARSPVGGNPGEQIAGSQTATGTQPPMEQPVAGSGDLSSDAPAAGSVAFDPAMMTMDMSLQFLCAANNGGCDQTPLATCSVDTAGARTCACPLWYYGDGVGDEGCKERDECASDNGGCDTSPMATCTDADGQMPSCACPSGFTGTGVGPDGCVDVDECATDNGGCDTSPMATCTNSSGSRTCACPTGYSGDGIGPTGCAYVDECLSNNGGCDTVPKAFCANSASGPKCSCPRGYMGDGVGENGCEDLNECTTNNGGCDTSPMATCTNNRGSRTCSCPSGYIGSGVGSSGCAEDFCAVNNGGCDMSPMATCTNSANGAICTCPDGTGPFENDTESGCARWVFYLERGVTVDYRLELTWQRVLPDTYAGCTATYNNSSGGVSGEACSQANAGAYCSGLMLNSDTDWRLPSPTELESTVLEQPPGEAQINPESFPNTPAEAFWTSTLDGLTTNYLAIQFSTGERISYPASTGLYVRCVRSGVEP
jgi:hypothetical protein